MARFGRWLGAGVLLAAVTALPGAARADEDSYQSQYQPPKPQLRSDFLIGLGLGLALGRAVGYPNEAEKIGQREFRQVRDLSTGSYITLLFGGALRDWFSFGFGLSVLASGEESERLSQAAFITHLEGYPLYALGGRLRDLGVYLDAGAGGSLIQANKETIADGGSVAYLGAGSVFEWIRFGSFTLSPTLGYVHNFSPSMSSHYATLGARIVFYGGP
jgi:hypothetical protein